MTTIAIIGAGGVGATIGRKWSAAGHDVRFGVRDPESPKYADLVPLTVLAPRLAVMEAEVILLALPWEAVEAALADLGDLEERIIVDATNPLRMGDDGLELTHGHEASGAELIQRWAPTARVFKTLNQTGFQNMGRADDYRTRPMMFVAGDDADGKATVMQLVDALDFEAIDAGKLPAARQLEPLALLWIKLSMRDGRDFAFSRERLTVKTMTHDAAAPDAE